MKAIDLNKDIECPICKGIRLDPIRHTVTNKEVPCRRCKGTGTINRYNDHFKGEYKRDGSNNTLVLGEEIGQHGELLVHITKIMSHDGTGFDQKFSTAAVDPSKPMNVDLDTEAGKIAKSKGRDKVIVEDFLDTLPKALKDRILDTTQDLTPNEAIAFCEQLKDYRMIEFIKQWKKEGLI